MKTTALLIMTAVLLLGRAWSQEHPKYEIGSRLFVDSLSGRRLHVSELQLQPLV